MLGAVLSLVPSASLARYHEETEMTNLVSSCVAGEDEQHPVLGRDRMGDSKLHSACVSSVEIASIIMGR